MRIKNPIYNFIEYLRHVTWSSEKMAKRFFEVEVGHKVVGFYQAYAYVRRSDISALCQNIKFISLLSCAIFHCVSRQMQPLLANAVCVYCGVPNMCYLERITRRVEPDVSNSVVLTLSPKHKSPRAISYRRVS